MSPGGGAGGTSDWAAYLGALEALAAGVEAALTAAEADDRADARSDTWLPTVPDLAVPLPSGPPPEGTQERREALLARLVVLTARLERRRDDVAHTLAALPARRPRRAEPYAGSLGGGLDLVG